VADGNVLGIGWRLTVCRVPQRAELTASYAIDKRIDLLFEVHPRQDEGAAPHEGLRPLCEATNR
jgi:hypothetical protein